MSEKTKAGLFTATGAGACAIKGGSVGVVTSGIGVAIPVVAVGAVVGLAGYGLYSAFRKKKK